MEIQRATDRALQCITSCCYVGYLPHAPGTYASALGCVCIFLFPAIFGSIIFSAAFILFSVLAVNLYTYEGKDPGYIVIDELAGMCITMAGHRITFFSVLIGFLLFKFFDIVKPFPIKRVEQLKRGYGIVADDVLAGIFANIILICTGRILW